MIKLITVDMERAFLAYGLDKTRFQEQLDQMKQRGMRLVLTSDSPYSRFLVNMAKFRGPLDFVGENGAIVVEDGVIKNEEFIDHDSCQKVIKWLIQHGGLTDLNITLSGRANAYSMISEESPFYQRISQTYPDFYPAKDLGDIIDEIYQIRVDFSDGNAAALMQEINHHFRYQVAAEVNSANCIYIMNPDVNRARGVSKIKKDLKIKDDQVASIGADMNDLIILKHAKEAYSINNAVPELHQVTKPLVNDLIADTIDHLIKD